MWDHRQNKHGVSKIIDTFAMYQTSLLLRNFLLYNSPDPLRSVYRFLVVFLFRLVSARVCFQFRAIMASAGSNESKEFSDGDHQDPKAEEEVVSKAEEEEEDLGAGSHSTIASIRVVQNPSSFKRSARITVGGCFPTHD